MPNNVLPSYGITLKLRLVVSNPPYIVRERDVRDERTSLA